MIKSSYKNVPVTHFPEKNGPKTEGKPVHKEEEREDKSQELSGLTERQTKIMGVVDSIQLAQWDPRKLPKSFFVVFEGKRRTGKSTMCKWLLQYYKNNFSLAWCMTMTKASYYWQEFVGSDFTFGGWAPNAIAKLIERNDKIIKEFGEDSDTTYKLASTLIILDDVISANIHKDPTLIRLAVEGRHHMISVVLLTQDTKAISPCIRDNADVAIIFNMKTDRNKEAVWRDFMNDVPKDIGYGLISKHCVEHDSLVCVQTNLNADIQRNYFISVGDKTQLDDPDYALGDEKQQALVVGERIHRKNEMKMKAKGLQPSENDDTMLYTVDKILRRKYN